MSRLWIMRYCHISLQPNRNKLFNLWWLSMAHQLTKELDRICSLRSGLIVTALWLCANFSQGYGYSVRLLDEEDIEEIEDLKKKWKSTCILHSIQQQINKSIMSTILQHLLFSAPLTCQCLYYRKGEFRSVKKNSTSLCEKAKLIAAPLSKM